MAEYLSDVAPDRKMLYQWAKNAMKNQNNNPKCKGIGELTLLDFFEAADGRVGNLAEKRFALAGGGILTCPILTTGGYGAVIISNLIIWLEGWYVDENNLSGSTVSFFLNVCNTTLFYRE